MLVVFICSSGYSPTMGSEGYQGEQLGVQISSERSTRQCKPEEEPLSVSVYVDFAGSIPQPGG